MASLSVVVPTYNERENVPVLIELLHNALARTSWEVIFVDDDSPDQTAETVRRYAEADERVRLLYRVGRRGLFSASLEGMLATTAPYIVVMDGDLQHDESIIPQMLQEAESRSLDLVVATRHALNGSMGSFSKHRIRMSNLGKRISCFVSRSEVSDPMSGFFLIRRDYLLRNVHALQGRGFKTLADILASGTRPIRIGEVGYCFRSRAHGQSKLDVCNGIDFIFWAVSKSIGKNIPARFAAFAFVGSIGIPIHLAVLALLYCRHHASFPVSQASAAFVAMTSNFFLNNMFTYQDRQLHGARMLRGLLVFWVACSLGAFANVSVARSLLEWRMPWIWAGLIGIVVSSVWNYAVNDLCTWTEPGLQQ